MRALFSLLLDPLLRRSRDRRMDDEMRAHLEMLTDDYVARGLSRPDAELAAPKSFGVAARRSADRASGGMMRTLLSRLAEILFRRSREDRLLSEIEHHLDLL